MFQIDKKLCKRTKNVHGSKKCASVAHYGILVSNCRTCLVWPCVALCGLVFALYDVVLPYVVLYGLLWPCVASYGLVADFYDHVWPHST